jgi:AraC-like DNA-binding protein
MADLYESTVADALLCVGAGKTLYVGSLDDLDWHRHGAPVFIAGMVGKLRLRLPTGEWISCRAAIIPAGLRHALELGGDPIAVFYPEPGIANISHLARLGHGWELRSGILIGGSAELACFHELYEDRNSLKFAGESLEHLVGFIRGGGAEPLLDPRIARVIARLDRSPDDLTAVVALAQAEGLSPSYFIDLFGREIGIPFRRFRIWNRVRAALGMTLGGMNLTHAALAAGFTDSAHFARLHRETFGVAASRTLSRIARAGSLARSDSRVPSRPEGAKVA